MKLQIFLFVYFLSLSYLQAQIRLDQVRTQAYYDSILKLEADNSGKIYEIYEKPQNTPEFMGGIKQEWKYLTHNFKYPRNAQRQGIQGKAIVRFVVATDGSIENAQIKKKVEKCPECDEEALRLIRNMPKWLPAVHEGKRVKAYTEMPINFRILLGD